MRSKRINKRGNTPLIFTRRALDEAKPHPTASKPPSDAVFYFMSLCLG